MKFDARSIARAGVIAGVYAGLCLLLAPISYKVFQVRVAEALAVLPIVWPEAVVGACLWSAHCESGRPPWRIRRNLRHCSYCYCCVALLGDLGTHALLMPFPLSSTALWWGRTFPSLPEWRYTCWTIPAAMLLVAAGEAVAVLALGVPLLHALRRTGIVE